MKPILKDMSKTLKNTVKLCNLQVEHFFHLKIVYICLSILYFLKQTLYIEPLIIIHFKIK